MAFLSKVGNILGQSAAKQVSSEAPPFKLPIFQVIRWMSSGPSSKLFIGGISYGTDEPSLREAFAKYGEVVDARIIVDRETGRSRGFGFITYTSSEEASSAIQALDGQELHGRRVRVNYATDRRNSFGGSGGYSGGGGYVGGGGYGGGGYGGGGGYSGGGGGYSGGNYNSNYGDGSYGGSSGGFSGSNYASTGDAGAYGSNTGNYNVAGGAGGSEDFASGLGGSNYAATGDAGGYGSNTGNYSGAGGSDNFASGIGDSDNFAGGVGGDGSFGGGYDGSSGSGFGGDGQFTGSSGNDAADSAFGDNNQDGQLKETFRDDDDADVAKRA